MHNICIYFSPVRAAPMSDTVTTFFTCVAWWMSLTTMPICIYAYIIRKALSLWKHYIYKGACTLWFIYFCNK